MAVEMVRDKETKHVVICLETEMRKMAIPAYQTYDFGRRSFGRTVIFTINNVISSTVAVDGINDELAESRRPLEQIASQKTSTTSHPRLHIPAQSMYNWPIYDKHTSYRSPKAQSWS